MIHVFELRKTKYTQTIVERIVVHGGIIRFSSQVTPFSISVRMSGIWGSPRKFA